LFGGEGIHLDAGASKSMFEMSLFSKLDIAYKVLYAG